MCDTGEFYPFGKIVLLGNGKIKHRIICELQGIEPTPYIELDKPVSYIIRIGNEDNIIWNTPDIPDIESMKTELSRSTVAFIILAESQDTYDKKYDFSIFMEKVTMFRFIYGRIDPDVSDILDVISEGL